MLCTLDIWFIKILIQHIGLIKQIILNIKENRSSFNVMFSYPYYPSDFHIISGLNDNSIEMKLREF